MLGTVDRPEFMVLGLRIKGAWLAAIIVLAIRLIGATLRFRITDEARYFSGDYAGRYIFVCWHNRMFVMPILYARFHPRRKVGVAGGAVGLTSASGEGTILTLILAAFGIGAVRGSSSRRGAAALRELCARILAGDDVVITPDGPRGPRHRIGPGVIVLAEKTSAAVMPIRIEYSRSVTLRTWDRFEIPLPFSRVDVTLHAIHPISRIADEAAFESARRDLEQALL